MNDLKKSALKTTMPDELKKRILHEAESIAFSEDDGYEDSQVFTIEKARPVRMTRIISAAAACAVLAGGIAIAGVNISRNNGTSDSMAEVSRQLPPFGDITEHTLAEVSKNRSPLKLSDEQVQQIADLLSSQSWEEVDSYDPERTDVEINRYGLRISYWFNYTDSEYDSVREGFFISPDGMLVSVTPDGTHYYTIDYDRYDRELRKILGYPARSESDSEKPVFSMVHTGNSITSEEVINALTEFFNEQPFEPADISAEEAAEMGIAYSLGGWGDDWDDGQFIFLYRTGYLQFSMVPELTRMYKVDYELFNKTIGDLLSENGGVTGADSPFAEFGGTVFSVTYTDENDSLKSVEVDSAELKEYFRRIYWANAEPAEIPAIDSETVTFGMSENGTEASLTFYPELNIAAYSVLDSSGERESFYKIDSKDITFALEHWCSVNEQ